MLSTASRRAILLLGLSSHIQIVIQLIYLPTTFLLVAPFAVLSWGWAAVLWSGISSAIFGLAAYLIWDLACSRSFGISTALVVIMLLNCEVLAGSGNSAGIVVGTCVIAVWCFVETRFALVGVLCLVISLLLKPHDSGLIWLYLLLAGGAFRKRALQVLALTTVFFLIALAWMSHSAPHWWPELHNNLIQNAAPGSASDPGPNSASASSIAGVIGLQTIIRIFSNDPRIYIPLNCLITEPSPRFVWRLELGGRHRPSESGWRLPQLCL